MDEPSFADIETVWWLGVVENRKDPLQINRVQVRIFKWHPDNKALVPTNDLPWASVEMPVTNTTGVHSLKEGDWVKGHFLDGRNGQHPVVTAFISGIDEVIVPSDKGFSDPRTEAQLKTAPRHPIYTTTGQTVSAVFPDKGPRYPEYINTPTTSPLARGDIRNTGIAYANYRRVHVCDPSGYIGLAISKAIGIGKQIIQGLREAVIAILEALGINPAGNGIVQFIKKLARYIRDLAKFINEISTELADMLTFIAKIKAVIAFILSLPAELAAYFAHCIQEAIGELATGILESFSGSSDGDGIVSAAVDLASSVGSLATASARLALVPVVAITAPPDAATTNALVSSFYESAGIDTDSSPSRYTKP